MKLTRHAAGIGLALLCAPGARSLRAQDVLVLPGANSRPTYFTVHNVEAAQRISRGKGVRIGILDHFFGVDAHPELYAASRNFLPDDEEGFRTASEHGYWMALVAREIAPDAELVALNTTARTEAEKVDAMVRAIDWAIANDVDVLTYSDRAFTAGARPALDAAVERAVRAGIVTTFVHYPHPDNLLPGWIGPRTGDDEREPDVNILQFDYSKVFVARLLRWQRGEATGIGNHPFLSISSMSPVTAGLVALLRSAKPSLTPAEVKQLLMATSRPLVVDGMSAARVADAHAALLRVR